MLTFFLIYLFSFDSTDASAVLAAAQLFIADFHDLLLLIIPIALGLMIIGAIIYFVKR